MAAEASVNAIELRAANAEAPVAAPPAIRAVSSNPVVRVVTCTRKWKSKVLQPQRQFYFLRPDTQEVNGLQDWSVAGWTHNLSAHPASAKKLVGALIGSQQANAPARQMAALIRAKLSEPLTDAQWRQVVAFQNEVINNEHSTEKAAAMHYMNPSLLSNMIFDRECEASRPIVPTRQTPRA